MYSTVADPEISEPGGGDSNSAVFLSLCSLPLHIKVDKKILIVNIACCLHLKYMRVMKPKFTENIPPPNFSKGERLFSELIILRGVGWW